MSLISYLHELYSLDTLDKRFTAASKPANVARRRSSREDVRSRAADLPAGASPPRWKTSEFFLYYGVFLVCVPLMFKGAYDASLRKGSTITPFSTANILTASHPNYKSYEHLLSTGWIPGRKVDNSDAQYSNFRGNIPYLLILFLVHPLLRKLYNRYFPVKLDSTATPFSTANGSAHPAQAPVADARLDQRVSYDLAFALLLTCILHGFSAIKIFILLGVNFLIATKLPESYVVPMTWIYNVFVLFANELCRGYSFTLIANTSMPFTVWDPNSNWGTFFDEHGGLIPRWEVLFNITILRLISYNMDFHWSGGREGGSSVLEVGSLSLQSDPHNDRWS